MNKEKMRKTQATQAIILGDCGSCFKSAKKKLLIMWYMQCALSTWETREKVRYGKLYQTASPAKQLMTDFIAAGYKNQ